MDFYKVLLVLYVYNEVFKSLMMLKIIIFVVFETLVFNTKNNDECINFRCLDI